MENPEELYVVKDRIQLLEEMMDEYGEALTRVAITYVKDRFIAEDIIQDSFLKAYKKLNDFEGKSSYHTYLYRIVINGCYDHLRSWNHRKVQLTEKLPLINNGVDTSEQFLLDKSRNYELGQQVLKLSIKLREVIILYYYQDFNIEEIAEVLKVSKNTVKTRMFRARKKLESQLQESGWEW